MNASLHHVFTELPKAQSLEVEALLPTRRIPAVLARAPLPTPSPSFIPLSITPFTGCLPTPGEGLSAVFGFMLDGGR